MADLAMLFMCMSFCWWLAVPGEEHERPLFRWKSRTASSPKPLPPNMKQRPLSEAIPKSQQQKPTQYINASIKAQQNSRDQSVLIARVTMPYWYRAHYSREDAIHYLRSLGPGSFIIRESSTVRGGYALTIKVSQEMVRERLKLSEGIHILATLLVLHVLATW